MNSTIFFLGIIVILTQVYNSIQRIEIPNIPSNWTYAEIKKHTNQSNLGENLCMFFITDYKDMEVEDLNSCYKQIEKNYTRVIQKFTSQFNNTLSKYAYDLIQQGKNVTILEASTDCVIKAVNMCPPKIEEWISDKDKRMLALEGIDEITPYKLYYNITPCDTEVTIFLKQQLQTKKPNAVSIYKEVEKYRRKGKKKSEKLYKKLTDCLNSLDKNILPNMS